MVAATSHPESAPRDESTRQSFFSLLGEAEKPLGSWQVD